MRVAKSKDMRRCARAFNALAVILETAEHTVAGQELTPVEQVQAKLHKHIHYGM
jgi:hypothetical protein